MSGKHPGCEGCGGPSRRDFIGSAVTLVLLGTAIGEVRAERVSGDVVTYPLPDKDGVSIDKKEQVILVRFHNKVMAFPLSCPHENTALKWRQNDGRFQCPKHESKYTPEGVFTSGRATRNMDRFAITRLGNSVNVQMTKWFASDKQPSEWAAASITV
jgi:Rieske Fe-S protein